MVQLPELCYLAKVASSVEMNQSGEWAWVQGSALKIGIQSHHAEVSPDLHILGKKITSIFSPVVTTGFILCFCFPE